MTVRKKWFHEKVDGRKNSPVSGRAKASRDGNGLGRSISPRRDRSTQQRGSTRQRRGSTHKLPTGLPIERMLGSRHPQGGLIHRTRLGKLQTDETQTGGKVRREHLGCFAHGFGYTVFKEITRVAGAPVVRFAALLRHRGLGIIGENARRYEGAILRRRQPEGQKDNCNDATGERHAPLSTLIGPILSITECPHLKRGMPVKTYLSRLAHSSPAHFFMAGAS